VSSHVPHLKVVVAFCMIAIAFYAGFSIYVVAYLRDAALTGDVIGTWKSFAVAVMAFWVGSSSGSKAKDNPSGTTDNPVITEVQQPANKPVPTTDMPRPTFGVDNPDGG
jgi:hypothetical protein